MKQILIGLVLLFLAFPLFSQEWNRNVEIEYELEYWDVYVEVYDIEIENEYIINFFDYWSWDWFDIREQMSGLMFVLMDSFEDEKITDTIDYIVFVWYDEENDEQWEIHMDNIWLDNYQSLKRTNQRLDMLEELITSVQVQWEDANRLYLKRGLDVYEEGIYNQQQLQEEWDSFTLPDSPPQMK